MSAFATLFNTRTLLTSKLRGLKFTPTLFVARKFQMTSRKENLVCVTKEGHLHLIGINRPEKRNCVNPEVASLLKTAFERFSNDANAYVAVLYGIGGTFCAGYDLKEISTGNATGLSEEDGPMGPTRMLLKKPVIAAIDGYAVAGGLELALWCDLRVMEETAKLGVFCRRFGVPLIDGGTVRLPQLIGLARALDLILTGRAITGQDAYKMGLVTKLCKKGEVLNEAVLLANSLCEFPQECLKADRLSAYNATFNAQSLDEALQYEHNNGLQTLVEAMSGAKKFVEGFGRHGQRVETDLKSKL